ncbi:putative dna repair protein rad26 protein [Neofusicoccum parvum UCRNP2]|uniref:Putative dna repair protein rad26 protein n=1 Tax=Botryosphaeria parva (strain UCR-NP2) TaxID=1287680 RepID=R1GNE9_BOTPV|nr:putative dna repair protein rad26 protein [Neofusicoccum parvum UCRNP2]
MADDDDGFGDADLLDQLPDDTLSALETSAYLATQRRVQSDAPPSANTHPNPALPPAYPPSPDYGFDAFDDEQIQLDGQLVAPGPPVNTATGPARTLQAAAPPPRFGSKPPAPVRTHTTRRTAQDLGRDGIQPYHAHRLTRHARNSTYNAGSYAASAADQPEAAEDAKQEDLLGRIQESKSGEAAIIRDNFEKREKEHAAQLSHLQKTLAADIIRLKTELEEWRRKWNKTDNEKKFLEQDLKVETSKAKQGRRVQKDGAANGNATKGQNAVATPRKNRIAHGDGFDDGDIMMVSPSKSRDKSRTGTPKQGTKRKRTADEASPSKQPLPLSEHQPADEGMVVLADVEPADDVFADAGKDDQKFKVSAVLKLSYRPLHLIIDTLQFVLAFEPLQKTASLAEGIGCITPSTYGPITNPPSEEDAEHDLNNATLFDYLTTLLHETPSIPTTRPALWQFRVTLLQTLSAFLSSAPAAEALASHKLFLGRLFTLLNAAVCNLYTIAPGTPLATALARAVGLATRIAYSLITSPATRALVDRRARLAAVHGASHAHLVALTRIAFTENEDDGTDAEDGGRDVSGGYGGAKSAPVLGSGGRVLEAGIEDEVANMAHVLLDEFLSPEEGEELVKVFSTARTER